MKVCAQGHPQTVDNVYVVNGKDRTRRRCKPCALAARKRTGRHKQIEARQNRMEDIADLISFGASFEDVIERGPYANWVSLNRAFNKHGRTDLQEKMRNLRNNDVADHKFNGARFKDDHMSTMTFMGDFA